MRNVTPRLSFTIHRRPARNGRGLVALIFFRGWLVQYIRALDEWLLEEAVRDWVEVNEYDPELYALPDAPTASPKGEPAPAPCVDPAPFRFAYWPVKSPRFILRPFGDDPAGFAPAGLPGHDGVDLAAMNGDEVVAVADGMVSAVVRLPAFGYVVRTIHVDGGAVVNVGPLGAVRVKPFETVRAGDVLGVVDSREPITALHVSTVRPGMIYVDEAGVTWPGSICDPTPFLAPFLAGGHRGEGE